MGFIYFTALNQLLVHYIQYVTDGLYDKHHLVESLGTRGVVVYYGCYAGLLKWYF